MLNPFDEINWHPDVKERRKFAASLIVGFPCLAAVLIVAERIHGAKGSLVFPLTMGGTGVAIGLILWLAPQIARPFYVGWYAAAGCAGFVIGNVVLASIYVLMFAPVGLLMRAMGRRAFRKGFDRKAPSYWQNAPKRDDPESYFRQF